MFDRKKLRQQIIDLFSEGELKTLCFDLAVDYDTLEGGEKATKVVALIAHLEKRGRLPALLAWLAEERPHTTWPSLETPPPQSPISNSQVPSDPRSSSFWSLPYGEPEWIEIPAGPFWMGSDKGYDNERSAYSPYFHQLSRIIYGDGLYSGEKPVHQLSLGTFCIARTPITNAQYALFVQATNHNVPSHWKNGQIPTGLENHPVTYVSWHDALVYCSWLSQVTGKGIVLPSEAEWEKASRGGKDKREYPWGDIFEPACTNTEESGWGKTTPVGKFLKGASVYGVLDMSGNTWEWTRSLWGSVMDKKPLFTYPYKWNDGRENLKAENIVNRVIRGGCWDTPKSQARCSFRNGLAPGAWNNKVGFRVSFPLFF